MGEVEVEKIAAALGLGAKKMEMNESLVMQDDKDEGEPIMERRESTASDTQQSIHYMSGEPLTPAGRTSQKQQRPISKTQRSTKGLDRLDAE